MTVCFCSKASERMTASPDEACVAGPRAITGWGGAVASAAGGPCGGQRRRVWRLAGWAARAWMTRHFELSWGSTSCAGLGRWLTVDACRTATCTASSATCRCRSILPFHGPPALTNPPSLQKISCNLLAHGSQLFRCQPGQVTRMVDRLGIAMQVAWPIASAVQVPGT